MGWAIEGAATSRSLRSVTESLRQHMVLMLDATADPVENENGGAASEGFVDGCDAYDAFMFVAVRGGREYCVTVEDVTT